MVPSHARRVKKTPRVRGFFYSLISRVRRLNRSDVDRSRSFLTLFDIERDFLTFVEGFVTVAIDRCVVNEYVFATFFRCDKAKALGCVEPLNRSSTQDNALNKTTGKMDIRTARKTTCLTW